MPSTEQTYRSAAKEHLERAQSQFEEGSYYLTHYLSGLAVECHLRAWLRRKTADFELYSRHDLRRLANESQFYGVVPAGRVSHFSTVVTTAYQRWKCNHRYYSERQFFEEIARIQTKPEMRGERWKEHVARIMLNCAYEVVNEGEAQWNKK